MRILRSVPPVADAPIALTIGNFDGVHLGHQAMLSRLREAAKRLGVPACVMTFEPHPREFFAPDRAPTRLTSLREKLELLRAGEVARTHLLRFNYALAQMSPADFIDRILVSGLNVRWLLVGDDFRFGARRAGDFLTLKKAGEVHGFDVESMSSVMQDGVRVSSTAVRDALAAGDVESAARLLGRAYSISGRVMHGDKLGRKLGFPTANVQMKHNRPPVAGIFAVEVAFGDRGRPGRNMRIVQGVASLGVRPTVKAGGAAVLEVNLFDFSEEIYGQHVRVDFLHKFRDEEKYVDLDTLTKQIAADVVDARDYFRRRDARRA